MKSFTVISLRRNVSRPKLLVPTSTSLNQRHQSSLSDLEESLSKLLLNRETHPKWDKLPAKHSNDLSIILLKYLPHSSRIEIPPPKLRETDPIRLLPQGHHQVYFNNLFAENQILRDGTDRAHYPGAPFFRRLWAGGSLRFNPMRRWMMRNDNLGLLQENIEKVQVKGEEGAEKVFVTISRKAAMYWAFNRTQNSSTKFPPDLRTFQDDFLLGSGLEEDDLGKLALEEKKTLVFLRARTKEEIQQDLSSIPKIIKPAHEPDYSISMKPSAHLLARFSMLTYNAHRIHLDTTYCREQEGYRNLLVQGPLTQVLMLSVLRSQLNQDIREMVYHFDYKNLAPLYANEQMQICVRRRPDNPQKFDVWIEGKEGGYAVKATAEVGPELDLNGNPYVNSKTDDLGEEKQPETLVKRVESRYPNKSRDKREHFKQLIDVFKGTTQTAEGEDEIPSDQASQSQEEYEESFEGQEESTNHERDDKK